MWPNIKVVVFDLDDTLYDCSGTLIAASRQRAARALVDGGLPMSVDEALALQNDLAEVHGPHFLVFDEIGRRYGLDDKVLAHAYRAYNSESINADIRLFPDTLSTINELRALGVRCFLLTVGHHSRQMEKIQKLGLEDVFDDVLINDYDRGSVMSECLRYWLQKHNLKAGEVLIVGDRPGEEIRHGNELGMVTVQFLHGRFALAKARDEFEVADHKISSLFQVPTIVKLNAIGKTPDKLRIVAVGGGTGLPVVLRGCKAYCESLTAIVAVTDSGRSTGRLRSELGILAPGDIRNCLVALSEPGEKERQLNRLFQYRFQNGSLDGMNLGNLLIAAMTELEGSFETGIKVVSELLSINGEVLPSTVTNTNICAELADGSVVNDEVSVSEPDKPAIKRVFLDPGDVQAPERVVDELKNADIVILGPGSLYTSVIPNVLVPDVRKAIIQSSAKVCFVTNIVTQPGETDGFTSFDHYSALRDHMGADRVDAVLVNSTSFGSDMLERYRAEGAEPVRLAPALENLGVEVVETDLCESLTAPRVLWEKQDLLRHHPDKLGDSVCRIFAGLPARENE